MPHLETETRGEHVFTCTFFNNILRLFDILPNFPFTTSDAMRDYYL